MSIEKQRNFNKSSPGKIERMGENEIVKKLVDENSPENTSAIFGDMIEKVALEPDLYYLEESNGGISVKKKADKSIIYFTDTPEEIEALNEAEKSGKV